MVDLLRVNILVDAIMFHIGAFFCKFLILITIDLDFVLLMVLYYCLSSLSTKKTYFGLENQANVSTKHADKKIIAATKYSFLTINVIELKLSSLLFYLSSLRC